LIKLRISPAETARILGFAVMFIFFANAVVRTGAYIAKSSSGGEKVLDAIYPVFDVGHDTSIHTWYSSLTLLLCSVLLAAITVVKKRCNDHYTRHWGLLSVIFLLLSIDDVATIHEHIGEVSSYVATSMGYTPKGFLYWFWVAPGAICILVLLLMYLRFLTHLPKKTLLLFLGSGLMFVGGAIGLEMVAAQLAFLSDTGEINPETIANKAYVFVEVLSEEALEDLGVIVFIYALLAYMERHLSLKEVVVRIGTKSAQSVSGE
jgi:hypothetical protein